MELNRALWYVRWFFWSTDIIEKFTDSRFCAYQTRERTNLCFFVQAMLMYAPLILLLHAVFVVAAIASVTAWPIYLYGVIGYAWIVGVIAAMVAAI